jgi:hypothetical protein
LEDGSFPIVTVSSLNIRFLCLQPTRTENSKIEHKHYSKWKQSNKEDQKQKNVIMYDMT